MISITKLAKYTEINATTLMYLACIMTFYHEIPHSSVQEWGQ